MGAVPLKSLGDGAAHRLRISPPLPGSHTLAGLPLPVIEMGQYRLIDEGRVLAPRGLLAVLSRT